MYQNGDGVAKDPDKAAEWFARGAIRDPRASFNLGLMYEGGEGVPKDAQIIDAAGKTVMPGLADLHVHLQGAWDGTSVDLLGYQRYLNAMLYSGVTTLLDTGNYQPWILQLRQEQAAGRLRGPRIYCVGAMMDAADPAWPDLAYAISSRYQIPEFVRRDKAARDNSGSSATTRRIRAITSSLNSCRPILTPALYNFTTPCVQRKRYGTRSTPRARERSTD